MQRALPLRIMLTFPERPDLVAEITHSIANPSVPRRYVDGGLRAEFYRSLGHQLANDLPNLLPEIDRALSAYGVSPVEVVNHGGTVESPIAVLKRKLTRHSAFWQRFAEKKPMTAEVAGTPPELGAVRFIQPNLGRVFGEWLKLGGQVAEIKDGVAILAYSTPHGTVGSYRIFADVLVPALPVRFTGKLYVDRAIVSRTGGRCSYLAIVNDAKHSVSLTPHASPRLRWTLIRLLCQRWRGRYSRQELRHRLENGAFPTFVPAGTRGARYRVTLGPGKVSPQRLQFYRERIQTARRRAERVEQYEAQFRAEFAKLTARVAASLLLRRENAAREVTRREESFRCARSVFWEMCLKAMYQKALPPEPFATPPWSGQIPSWKIRRMNAGQDQRLRSALSAFEQAHLRLLDSYGNYEKTFGNIYVSDLRIQCEIALTETKIAA